MDDYIRYRSSITLNCSGVDAEVKVLVLDDIYSSLVENDYMVTEVSYRDLPSPIAVSFTEYGATMAIDNYDHSVYIKASSERDDFYFVLAEGLKELQASFLEYEQGITKAKAWDKALESAKFTHEYVRQYFNDDWSYIALAVSVTFRRTENGLIWSHEVDNVDGCLHGIEWCNYFQSGDKQIIQNDEVFKCHIPDLLPESITLTEEQVHELFLNLE